MSGKHRKISRTELLTTPSNFLALGLGAGLAPIAPGTFGTLVAIPFYFLLIWLGPAVYSTVVLISLLAGVIICAGAAEALGVHDHSGIVWDEIVGFWITMCFIPFSWPALILGFLLFRFFDIVKPWPIRKIDRQVGGGLGIMLDDVIAAVFANIVLRVLQSYSFI